MPKTCGIEKTVLSVSCARFKSHFWKSRPPPPTLRPRNSCICPCLSRRRRSTQISRIQIVPVFLSAGGVNARRLVTFQKSFIGLKSSQNITLKYLGMYVKHSLHTCKCSFSYFSSLYITKISNLIDTHYTV